MSVHINSVFRGGQIPIDGEHFEHCTFENCVLVYAGGQLPTMSSCTFVDCNWHFDGPSARTCAFLASLYQRLGDEGRALVEEVFESIRKCPLSSAPRTASATSPSENVSTPS